MRRPIFLALAAALLAGLAVSAVTLARNGDRTVTRESAMASFQHVRQDRAEGHFRGLAERLGVTPRELKDAVRATARQLPMKRIKRIATGRGATAALPKLKRRAAARLGAELDKPASEVVETVRAELAERLAYGVGVGMVSDRGRDLALACFDDPASCDVPALRRELSFG